MNEPNEPRRIEDMDELTAVQQLLAERPPPAPDIVAAARASLERAAMDGTRGRVPLHLNGSRGMPDPGQPVRGAAGGGGSYRWPPPWRSSPRLPCRWPSRTWSGAGRASLPARPAAAFARVPRYFVALTGNALPDQGQRAVAVATATGKVLGSVAAPAPYRVFTWVAAAGDDRTFVLAAQRARPVGGALGQVMGVGAAKLYRLVLHRSGRPGALEPLSLPLLSDRINGFALSPDGTKLAVSTTRAVGAAAGGSQIQVFTLATGAVRSWVLGNVGWVGQDKPSAESLAWAGDNRTLLFKEYLGEGGSAAEIRLLDTAAPGGFLAAASTRVPFPSRLISGRVEDPEQAYGIMLLTADGHKIITAVTRDTWHGRTGLPAARDRTSAPSAACSPRSAGEPAVTWPRRPPTAPSASTRSSSCGKHSALGRIDGPAAGRAAAQP